MFGAIPGGHTAVLSAVAWLLAALAAPAAPAAADAGSRPPSEVSIDIGWALPRGDLGEAFTGSDLGFGADSGLEIGFRWRHRFSSRWSLSPACHFVDFEDAVVATDEAGEKLIRTSSFRYSLEVMRTFGSAGAGMRPFLAAGAGLHRNRVSGWTKDVQDPLTESVFSLGWFARAGLRTGAFELSLLYTRDRFATWRFFWTDQEQSYVWDTLGVRAGWSFPL